MTMQVCILTKLLDCGSADLSLLEDINYDLDEILDGLMKNGDLSINSLFREVFRTGAMELKEEFELQKDYIEERIKEELEEVRKECIEYGLMTEEQIEEDQDYIKLVTDLELLHSDELNPEEDIECYCNYMDTHVFLKHIDFYRKWMESEVNDIEDKMGWEFKNIA